MSRRVVDVLVEGAAAEAIFAVPFTERAVHELKNRIARRVEARLGRVALDD